MVSVPRCHTRPRHPTLLCLRRKRCRRNKLVCAHLSCLQHLFTSGVTVPSCLLAFWKTKSNALAAFQMPPGSLRYKWHVEEPRVRHDVLCEKGERGNERAGGNRWDDRRAGFAYLRFFFSFRGGTFLFLFDQMNKTTFQFARRVLGSVLCCLPLAPSCLLLLPFLSASLLSSKLFRCSNPDSFFFHSLLRIVKTVGHRDGPFVKILTWLC